MQQQVKQKAFSWFKAGIGICQCLGYEL